MGAPRRSLAIACALAFASVSAASAATRDLTVTVSRLSVPTTLKRGARATFTVRYVVRGPASRRASAVVTLELRGNSRYSVTSLPARVRPAIWKWSVTDRVPALEAGTYRAVATITLRRSGKRIARTSRSMTVTVPAS